MNNSNDKKTKRNMIAYRLEAKHQRSIFLLIVCLVLFGLAPLAQAQTKKGCAGQTANAYKVGAAWAYDWGASAAVFPGNVEHVPMWWSYYGASQTADNTAAANLKSAGAKSLLAYNEPDHTDQANLTVAYALQGFRQAGIACAAAGLDLISPACADDNSTWMQQFMAAVASEGLKCDAVAVHSYLRDPNAFLSYVDGIHNRYGKNLWITEFAPTDWASPTSVTTAEVVRFINTVIPGLESRSYVIRYSWYCGTLPGPNVLGTAALFDTNGNLTDAGTAYKNAGASATPAPTTAPGIAKGDVNSNGTIDIVDALLVAQYYVGSNPQNFNAAVADVDCSGSINIVDALLIARRYVGLISAFPC